MSSSEPEGASVPLHAPLAWQLLALELDQLSVVDSPTVSAVGLAPMLTMAGLRAEADATLLVPLASLDDAGAAPPPPPPQAVSSRLTNSVATGSAARAVSGGISATPRC